MSQEPQSAGTRKQYILNGFLVGIASSAVVSLAAYWIGSARREPVFRVLDRTTVLRAEDIATIPLRVIKSDSVTVEGDLNTFKFYFWNNGAMSIRDTDVFAPIVVSFKDTTAQILDVRLLKNSRDVTDASLVRDPLHPNTRVRLNFRILERKDGLAGQILYEGNPQAEVLIYGVIEGAEVKKVLTQPSNFEALLMAVGVVLLIVTLGGVFTILLWKRLLQRGEQWSQFGRRLDRFLPRLFSQLGFFEFMCAVTPVFIPSVVSCIAVVGGFLLLVSLGVITGNPELQVPEAIYVGGAR